MIKLPPKVQLHFVVPVEGGPDRGWTAPAPELPPGVFWSQGMEYDCGAQILMRVWCISANRNGDVTIDLREALHVDGTKPAPWLPNDAAKLDEEMRELGWT